MAKLKSRRILFNREKNMENQKHVRPSWDDYFLNLLEPIGSRGSCDRGRSGAVIVGSGHTIIATGYVGAAPGQPHCDEVGHMMNTVIHEDGTQSQHCVRTLHAEENAILQCAKDGISVAGSTIYTKMVPCYNCAMRIVRVGIKRVVATKRYHSDQLSVKLFRDAEVNLVVMDNAVEEYKNQSNTVNDTPKEFKSIKEIFVEQGKTIDVNKIEQA
ncbi:MAG: hypothetical protein A2528_02555 [Candidatus Staskawiczbacteria bacterium RIFOXYD2_FULL_37_9]|nr:MAG: hypothetical protein A2416_02685 [Candidatus Staskawiczbacteria bacterium RIFOXYC1_FULL_37_52]OGZ87096.1 MAG: hypothetical protein A2444_01750 [Candidatus Staskawiczbacteria bacterium RIFOXYC2_FULL_37_19]OGZ89392.1 MAG: hypothetical protein A2581_00745 [Candidatus Staskawiczbacteria bacterium RIFOXYD1_FULL_37_110]OGZ94794.1 MAG: hypothetical protein A2528_02555 [Candidatus Staskawiczbacteria bacterium RIFOXYD2_FULL_37_9]